MRTKAAAAVAGGVILATAGLVAGSSSVSPFKAATVTTAETVTVTTPIPPCTLVGANGQVNDPCNVQLQSWTASFHNGLGTAAYYGKWKRSNPGEYTKLKVYATSAQSTPQPSVSTGFGAVVRWGAEQCRQWAPNLASCSLP